MAFDNHKVYFNNDDGSPIVIFDYNTMVTLDNGRQRNLGYFLDDWRCRFEHTNAEGLKLLVRLANEHDSGSRSAKISFRRPRFMIDFGHGRGSGLSIEAHPLLYGWNNTAHAELNMRTGRNDFVKPYVAWPYPHEENYDGESVCEQFGKEYKDICDENESKNDK
jgi:hypothetical protein